VWSSDHQAHFDWCTHGNNAATAQGHIAARDAALADCAQQQTPPPAPVDPCAAYATEAVTLAQKAAAIGCPSAIGPRWLQDYTAHYNWCRNGADPAVMAAEAAARAATYKACGGQ